MKNIIKLIEKNAVYHNIDRDKGLEVFLDYLIDFFEISQYLTKDGHRTHILQKKEENEILFSAAMGWFNLMDENLRTSGWFDSLGKIYEALYLGKFKSSNLGQFYTPESLCSVMALPMGDITYDTVVSDDACGSGRTLLAQYSKSHKGYYIGCDIDVMSVKMCALNMMIHGMNGKVLCKNSLDIQNENYWGFYVNEIRYPFPSPFYSLRYFKHTA